MDLTKSPQFTTICNYIFKKQAFIKSHRLIFNQGGFKVNSEDYIENRPRFEFFKEFTYHFLPLEGDDITIEQATQMSKAGGSCGGPYWPVRRSPTNPSQKFETEAKRIAFKLKAKFDIPNELPKNTPWWKKNTLSIKWMLMKARRKMRKYGVTKKPALVVTLNKKSKAFYNASDLEKKVNNFIIQAM